MGAYQIVGQDEIVGEDYLDDGGYGDVDALLGAAPRRGLASAVRRMAAPAVRQGRVAGRDFAVRPMSASRAQVMVLGIESSGTVAATASATITFRAQVLFRGRRLLVPDGIASAFTIDDIKIGNASQFAASGSVPAAAFGETVNSAGGDNLVMQTAQVSQDIVMTITNRSAAAVQFRAALFGDAVL